MFKASDKLLLAITAKGKMKLRQFREVFNLLCEKEYKISEDDEYKTLVHQTYRALDYLAHVDIDFSGGQLFITRPCLCLIPKAGLGKTAVLSGARTRSVVDDIKRLAKQFGCKITIEENSDIPLLPRQLFVHADTLEQFKRMSDTLDYLGFQDDNVPISWKFANLAKQLELTDKEMFEGGVGLPGFAARYFHPEGLCFRQEKPNDQELFLVDYKSSRAVNEFYLETSHSQRRLTGFTRDTARYFYIAHLGANVMVYDRAKQISVAPWTLPLPAPHGRALALSSGMAPKVIQSKDASWSGSEKKCYLAFSGVPECTMNLIGEKLLQEPLPYKI